MFDNFKKYRQERVLRTLTGEKRTKRIAHLDEVHDMGIIFNVGSEAEWNTLYGFVREMERSGKQVWLIGFQANKQVIEYIFTHPRTTIIHEKEDLTYFGLPKEGVIEGFAHRHFDLLIDTTPLHDFFSLYVANKCIADLKVTYLCGDEPHSPYTEKSYDLLLHGDKPLELSAYIAEIKRYLTMIKK